MGLESTTSRLSFNSRAPRPQASIAAPDVFSARPASRTVFLIDACDHMMTPPRDGGAAPFLTALRGVGTFAKARAKADIDIQSVNAGGRNAVQPDDDGRRVSLFEEGALQKAIMDVTVQAPSRLVIVTGGDPNDVDGLCSAARNHLKADARNSVDFLVVSAQWNAFNLGARLTEIGENVSLKTAASAPEVTQQLNNLFGTPPAAPAQTAKRQL